MMEAVLLLATITQRFSLSLLPDHPVVAQPTITLRPKHGVKVILERRAQRGPKKG
jgi:cytochrome P450